MGPLQRRGRGRRRPCPAGRGRRRRRLGGGLRLFVFDCYGTLLAGPRRGQQATAEVFADRLGVSLEDAKRVVYPLLVGAYVPGRRQPATEDVLRDGVAAIGRPGRLDEALDALWHAQGNAARDHRALEGAAELLDAVAAAGDAVRMLSNCLLTAAQMRRLLDDVGLGPRVGELYLSSEGRGKKPSVAFVRHAGAGPFSRRVMVGDDEALDLAPARAAGFATALVASEPPHFAAAWSHVADGASGV